MRFLIILLLASLASTSPVSKELQDKNYLVADLKDAVLPAEFASNNHPEENPENNLVHTEKLLAEFFNSVSSEDAEIESVNKAKNAEANQLQVSQPLSKIDQSEEKNKYIPAAANNVKKNLLDLIQNIKKDLEEVFEKFTNIMNNIVTSVPKVIKP